MNQLIKAVLVDHNVRSGIIVNGSLILKSDDFEDDEKGKIEIDNVADLLSNALNLVIVEVDLKLVCSWEKAISKLLTRGVIRKRQTIM